MTKWIGVIAKSNPTLARILELSFYGAILSMLQYLGNALTTSDWGSYQVALGMFITSFVAGVVSGLQSYYRAKQSKIENELLLEKEATIL